MIRKNIEAREIQSGDARAFDRLFDQLGPRVMGYLLRLTGNRTEAEDLTQETFLAAFAGREGFSGRSKPLTWLLGIAWRRWRDDRRKCIVVTEAFSDDTRAAQDPTERLAVSMTFDAALQTLDPAVRDAILLTAVQGLTYAEASRVLGEPVGTLKWRVHEGTREIRRLLSAAEERYEATERREPERSGVDASGRR